VPLFLLITSLFGFAYAGFAVFLFLWHMIVRSVMAHAGHEIFPAGWVDTPWLSWISTTTHHDLHHSAGHNYGFYFTWWDKWMGTEHPNYAEEFRKNAKPFRPPSGTRAASVS
jgi:sterol desaturase/sphingolipid hydroxylase (fatty acid hydroxylase superfamily)